MLRQCVKKFPNKQQTHRTIPQSLDPSQDRSISITQLACVCVLVFFPSFLPYHIFTVCHIWTIPLNTARSNVSPSFQSITTFGEIVRGKRKKSTCEEIDDHQETADRQPPSSLGPPSPWDGKVYQTETSRPGRLIRGFGCARASVSLSPAGMKYLSMLCCSVYWRYFCHFLSLSCALKRAMRWERFVAYLS